VSPSPTEEKMEEQRRGKHATAEEQNALMPDLRKVSREAGRRGWGWVIFVYIHA
jgi:hypothetical protein